MFQVQRWCKIRIILDQSSEQFSHMNVIVNGTTEACVRGGAVKIIFI